MSAFERALLDRIGAEGPITVAEYMEAAAAHYYAHAEPFGRAGDFTTAPEVSQMFGELIGLWLAVQWQAAGAPARVQLAELGPGRGTLMADALRAGVGVPGFLDAVHLTLVETSPRLREIQAAALADTGAEVAWAGDLADVPEGPLLVVANEFFDALPVRQFERTEAGWRERLVAIEAGALAFALSGDEAGAELPAGLADAPSGSLVEVRPAAEAIMGALAGRIAETGTAALVIDYGHAPSAPGDTLQAVRDHRFHPPLVDPGAADLTAHVDFQALGEAAEAAGARVFGPASQGDFLRALGIEARAARLAEQNADAAAGVAAALKRLIGADEMGTLFKVLAVTSPTLPPPEGFPGSQR